MSTCIYLKTPMGDYSLIKCKTHRLTIGRDPDNDLILADENVSPHHAEILFHHHRVGTPVVQVRDLGSADGTYLKNIGLPPGEHKMWDAKLREILKIGAYELVLLDSVFDQQVSRRSLTRRNLQALFEPAQGTLTARTFRWWEHRLLVIVLLAMLFVTGVVVGALAMIENNAAAYSIEPPADAGATAIMTPIASTVVAQSTSSVSDTRPSRILVPTATAVLQPTAVSRVLASTTPPVVAPLVVNYTLATPAPNPPLPTPVAHTPISAVLTLDEQLIALGVTVEPAAVVAGQPYWRLVAAQWLDEGASQGRHNIYVEVLDETGQRLVAQPVVVFWPGGSATGWTEDKPATEYAYNFPMGAAGPAYSLRIDRLPGDVVHGLGMGTPAHRDLATLTSFQLIFQRITQPDE